MEKSNEQNNNTSKFYQDPAKRKQAIIWLSVGIITVLSIMAGLVYIDRITNSPESFFDNEVAQIMTTQAPVKTPQKNMAPEQTPEPEPDYLEQLREMADFSEMKNVVNILLIGVDYADERNDKKKGAYAGKNFNSDVMLLLAVNFDENRADLISVPRDTFARIDNAPNAPYKLNFALHLGGGLNDDGFMNVCKSVEWVMGGIPVNYYIAVTMPMLKDVVDTFDGVNYDMDIDFKIQGRKYEKGPSERHITNYRID